MHFPQPRWTKQRCVGQVLINLLVLATCLHATATSPTPAGTSSFIPDPSASTSLSSEKPSSLTPSSLVEMVDNTSQLRDKFFLDNTAGKVFAEYIWIGGNNGDLRGKTKILNRQPESVDDLPDWNYDGSSTNQAPGNDSEVILKPVAMFPDPFRPGPHILVLCETYTPQGAPLPTNTRAAAKKAFDKMPEQEPWYGIEQEYTLFKGKTPLGWPEQGFPGPQGPYYCSAGDENAFGREIGEAHAAACLAAGLKIAGINAEVMPGQWEYQVGPCEGIESGDHLIMSRYIMLRVGELFGVSVSFDPKPVPGDWNGAGCHTNYSTKPMRQQGGWDHIIAAIEELGKHHEEHIKVYGEGNERRLTGQHETASIEKFSYGVADRGASIRIPRTTEASRKGYLEDRRPASNMDPYVVTFKIFETTVLNNPKAVAWSKAAGFEPRVNRVLLDSNVRPSKYTLHIDPDFEAYTFQGKAVINVNVAKPTNTVQFHTKELTLFTVTFTDSAGKTQAYDELKNHQVDQMTTASFDDTIAAGEGVLTITYEGILNDKMAGFYRSTYTAPNGESRIMGTTQFEATDARRAFPCWDEPAVKATFQVTISGPGDRTILSNMPETRRDTVPGKPGWVAVTFDETPKMSTYLLAWVIGEYEAITAKSDHGVEVRVFTPPGKTDKGKFALDVAKRCLDYFDDYFAIKYPLPKSDLIAIPDFAAGAMENWGLVTYREVILLADSKTTSASRLQQIAITVCHELAHQWFGNLVTMEWWNNLWLNEGFATWVSYLAVDHLFPEWAVWTQFLSDDVGRALKLDALKSSHPIEVDIAHSSQIDEIFDAISYSKGGSVIQMLHAYVGPTAFRDGLRAYLEEHKYANTVTEDLWRAIGKASGKPVLEVMSVWTKQTGYPILTIGAKTGDSVQVSQQRFLSTGLEPAQEGDPNWLVPLNIVSSSGKETTALLREASETIKVEGAGDDWFKINAGQAGVYRVLYDDASIAAIAGAISSKSLPTKDRYGIAADVFAGVRAGIVPAARALSVTAHYAAEDDFTVWAAIGEGLADIRHLFAADPEIGPGLEKFYRNLFGPVAKTVGWAGEAGESHLQQMLRPLVLSGLARGADETTIAQAKSRFAVFQKDPSSLDPNLRRLVFSLVVSSGGETGFNNVLDVYKNSDDLETKLAALFTLGSTPDETLQKRALDMILSPDVRSQDVIYVARGVASNSKARSTFWTWFKVNMQAVIDRVEAGSFIFGGMIKSSASSLSTAADLADVESFFKAHPMGEVERTVGQVLESIRSNIDWFERDAPAIKAFLKTI